MVLDRRTIFGILAIVCFALAALGVPKVPWLPVGLICLTVFLW